MLFATLACGGRSLKYDEPAGADSVAGAPNYAGASNSAAGASNSAGAMGNMGGDNGFTACAHDEDCVVLPRGCCGAYEPVDAAQLVSVNSGWSDEFARLQCPNPIPCPPPPARTEYDQTQKYFRAICFHDASKGPTQPGTCELLDVRGTAFSTCITSSDCTLREGVSCCPGCDGSGWVPVNANANFCSVSTPCGHCTSFPPAGLETSCQASTCRFAPPKR